MKSLIALLFGLLFISNVGLSNTNNWEDKVSPTLLEKFIDVDQTHYCLVLMDQQLDVINTSSIKGKANKTREVFNRLSIFAHNSQKEIISFLHLEDVDYRSFYIINAIKVKVDLALIEAIASRGDVARIINDPSSMIQIEAPDALEIDYRGGEPEWGIKMIQADSVWSLGYRGEGVVIAGQDTGYNWDNPLLKAAYRGWDGASADHQYNWHDAIHEISPLHGDSIIMDSNNPCGIDIDIPCDDHDHGTHTMGTMVGEDDDNAIGVAPESSWIACRCMERGYGSPTTYIECFEWFLAPTDLDGNNPNPDKAPHVINNSWGCPPVEGCEPDNFEVMNMVVEQLKAAGIVVVVSAGNSGNQGCGSVDDPAAMFEGSFTVGASMINDTLAGFSSRGPVMIDSSFRLKPNVVAPGRSVRSVLRDSTFASWNGTSMAGPHVAGAVALMISANPDLAGEVELIEDILEETADKKYVDADTCAIAANGYPNNLYGYGRINVLKAVERVLAILNNDEVSTSAIPFFYPNPVDDIFTVELPLEWGEAFFTLYNVDGQKILEKMIIEKTERIRVDHLPKGSYYYQIRHIDRKWSGKLIKM